MKKPTAIFKRSSPVFGKIRFPHEMDHQELHQELSLRLEREKVYRDQVNERETLIYELELHQLELEIQNRELIQSQKYLEEAKNKYLELYDSAPVGHISLDTKGKILSVNFTCAKILNKEKVNIVGKSLSSWIAKDFKRQFSTYLNDCLTNQSGDKKIIQLELTIPDCKVPVHVEIHSSVSTDLQQDRKILNLAIVDISETKKIDSLKSQVKEMHSEKELRENFVSTLSHDLRTPLTTSKLCAQMLSSRVPDPERQKRLYHLMVEELDRADRMIKELLDANRINGSESLPVIRKPCNLGKLVENCVTAIMELRPGTKIETRINQQIVGLWSKDSLQRITENLIHNALKYGSLDIPITVTVDQKANDAVLVVHNFGNPILKCDQKKLFEAFQQGSTNAGQGINGWGLGLNLVNKLVKRHNGEVKVKSNLSDGTTFTVVLPL